MALATRFWYLMQPFVMEKNIFQVFVTLAHLYFSKEHVAVLTSILVLGCDHSRQSPGRRSIIIFQVFVLIRPTRIPFFSAQTVINSKRNIEILRFHKHIKTLCIQITFHRISPFFILISSISHRTPGWISLPMAWQIPPVQFPQGVPHQMDKSAFYGSVY